MDPVSAISVAAAATQLTEQAATVFKLLFDYCRKVKQAPKLSADLQREMFLISNILDELKSALEAVSPIPQSAAQTHLHDTIEEFAKTMNDMAIHLKPIQKSEMRKRLAWPFTQKDNEEYLVKFRRYKDILMLALQAIERSNP